MLSKEFKNQVKLKLHLLVDCTRNSPGETHQFRYFTSLVGVKVGLKVLTEPPKVCLGQSCEFENKNILWYELVMANSLV